MNLHTVSVVIHGNKSTGPTSSKGLVKERILFLISLSNILKTQPSIYSHILFYLIENIAISLYWYI